MTPRSLRQQFSLCGMRRRKSRSLLFFNAFLFVALARITSAQTIWNAQTGDWFQPANWSDGVPDSATDAQINNGGTAQIALQRPAPII